MNFIVVQVHQNYDMVEGVDYIKSFSTEEEATAYIQKEKEKEEAAWKSRLEYIEQWVDAIECPETDYNGWKEYLKRYHPFGVMYVLPQNFKKNLKEYLRTHSAEIEGYDPPKANFEWYSYSLFVVKIA